MTERDPLHVAIAKETHPTRLYIVQFWGCVEPAVFGPYKDEDERILNAKDMQKQNDHGENCFSRLDIVNCIPQVSPFVDHELL